MRSRLSRVAVAALAVVGLSMGVLVSEGTETIAFKARGQDIRSLSLADIEQVAPSRVLTVWEPHEDTTVAYRGHPLVALLDHVYGSQWRRYELILFHCADGYKAAIPRTKIDANEGLLAVERVGAAFTLDNKFNREKDVPLAPLYLVWNNRESPQLRAEGAHNWPYQVVAIEVTDFAEKFPRMIPPAEASAAARRGFTSFQRYCMTCHKVNGDGGDKGRDLNVPTSVTRVRDRAWLVRFLLDPHAMQPTVTMPGLPAKIGNRERVARDIVRYLEAMATPRP